MAKMIEETLEEGLRFSYRINSILDSTQTQFQQVDVVDTVPFGRALIIDGLMQSSELDEFVYHECLVHPAMLSHPNPKTVFIGGGGEGSTAREVLRHKTVEKCVMCDIDEDVVKFCRKAMAANKEAFEDPRLVLIYDDAKKQLLDSPTNFDVIIMDLDDPVPGGPCFWLYTKDFYEQIKGKLNPGGVFVTQSSGAGVKSHSLVFSPVHNTLRQVFPKVHAYAQAVYCFADEWGYNLGFSDPSHALPTAAEIDERIAARITGELRFLDGQSFTRVFLLSKEVRKTLAAENRVLSKENPAFWSDQVTGCNKGEH